MWIDINDKKPNYDVKVRVKGNGHEANGHLSITYVRDKEYWCDYSPSIKSSQVTNWKEL